MSSLEPSTVQEALVQALRILENIEHYKDLKYRYIVEIQALRKLASEAGKLEPLGYVSANVLSSSGGCWQATNTSTFHIPIYSTPPKLQRLREVKVIELMRANPLINQLMSNSKDSAEFKKFADSVMEAMTSKEGE